MKIADLFINIGIKGQDKTVSAISDVKKGISDVASSSLAAKAAILGVIAGLEHMMSKAATQGMSLKQFAAFTGISTDQLQRWQYMARQSGVGADEMAQSIKTVQMTMDKMNTGQGTPKGLEAISRSLQLSGSGLDINRAVKDTMYLMDKLREYARTTKDTPQRANDWLASMGLSEGVIQMARTNQTKLSKIPRSQLLSEKEIGQNAKVEVAWANLGKKVEMAFAHLTAKKGLSIVEDISKLTDKVLTLVESLLRLADTLKVFKFAGKMLEGIGEDLDLVNEAVQNPIGTLKSMANILTPDDMRPGRKGENSDSNVIPRVRPAGQKTYTPPAHNSHITVHNHGVKDAKEGAHHVHKAVKDAYRQMPAQRQGS